MEGGYSRLSGHVASLAQAIRRYLASFLTVREAFRDIYVLRPYGGMALSRVNRLRRDLSNYSRTFGTTFRAFHIAVDQSNTSWSRKTYAYPRSNKFDAPSVPHPVGDDYLKNFGRNRDSLRTRKMRPIGIAEQEERGGARKRNRPLALAFRRSLAIRILECNVLVRYFASLSVVRSLDSGFWKLESRIRRDRWCERILLSLPS